MVLTERKRSLTPCGSTRETKDLLPRGELLREKRSRLLHPDIGSWDIGSIEVDQIRTLFSTHFYIDADTTSLLSKSGKQQSS